MRSSRSIQYLSRSAPLQENAFAWVIKDHNKEPRDFENKHDPTYSALRLKGRKWVPESCYISKNEWRWLGEKLTQCVLICEIQARALGE